MRKVFSFSVAEKAKCCWIKSYRVNPLFGRKKLEKRPKIIILRPVPYLKVAVIRARCKIYLSLNLIIRVTIRKRRWNVIRWILFLAVFIISDCDELYVCNKFWMRVVNCKQRFFQKTFFIVNVAFGQFEKVNIASKVCRCNLVHFPILKDSGKTIVLLSWWDNIIRFDLCDQIRQQIRLR